MSRLRSLLARLRATFSIHNSTDHLMQELQSHLEMMTEENIRRGMGPEEARRQARISLGGDAQISEARVSS